MRKFLVSAAVCTVVLINQAGAQVTLSRQPLWLAGSGDCNHAVYNNMSSPCNDSSPTGDNDAEYFSYWNGLIFKPAHGGPPSYFTPAGDMVLQGKGSFSNAVDIGTAHPGGVIFAADNLDSRGYTLPNLANTGKMLIGWNRTAGGGEIDFIANRAAGVNGGYGFYDYTNSGEVNNLMMLRGNGNLGLGTDSPGAKLEVNGTIKLTTGAGASITYSDNTVQSTAWNGVLSGGDYAESVDIASGKAELEPGDLIVIDHAQIGKFVKSSSPYSTLIGGVYATKPGVTGRRQPGSHPATDEIPMAMVGIVPTKVSAENGPIHQGDLLVSSATPGYAMKGTDRDRMMGAVIGKALAPLETGTGVVEVLISLQ